MNFLSISTFLVACAILAGSSNANAQIYKADIPNSIKTPDVIETERLGTLKFFDGMPDEETVKKVYDNLDFSRGVEAFLSGMPAASLYTMCTGFEKAGISAHTIAISEELLDAFNPEITGLFASIGIKKGQPFALLRSAAVAVVRSGSLLALRTRTSSIESWLIFATRIQPPPPCRY